MSSDRQIEANRRNAQLSLGKTEPWEKIIADL